MDERPESLSTDTSLRLDRILPSRLVLALVGVLFAVVTMVSAWDLTRWAGTPWPGFALREGGRLSFAKAADLPPELRVLAVEGRVVLRAVGDGNGGWIELAPSLDERNAAWRGLQDRLRRLRPGATAALRFAAGGRTVDLDVPLARLPAELLFERGILFRLIGLALAGIGFLVYRARPAAPEAVYFALFAALQGLELIAGSASGAPPTRLRGLEAFAAALAPASAIGLAALLEPRAWLRRRPWLLALPWALGGAVLLFDTLRDGPDLGLKVLRLVVLVLFAAWVVWLRATTRSPHRSAELTFHLVGLVAAFAPPILAYSLPRPDGVAPSPWVMLPVLLCPATIGYAIVRHRLFDVDLVLRRSVLLAVLSATGLLVYGALVAGGALVLGRNPATRSPLLDAAFVVAAIAVGGRLRSRLQAAIDRRLDPERFRYLEAVRQAGQEIGQLDSEVAVAESLARTATSVAGLEGAVVFLNRGDRLELSARSGNSSTVSTPSFGFDEPLLRLTGLVASELHRGDFDDNPKLAPLREICLKRMDALNAELLILIGRSDPRPLGLLALGRRQDGERFNREDLDLFRALAAQAALAIERARAGTPADHDAPTLAPPDPAPGVMLLHYRLDQPIGQGGMAKVWQASDRKLGRMVAIKLLHPDQSRDPVTIERLHREARTLAALSHPNIVQIYALEECRGLRFLVIERVEGSDLRQYLAAQGPRPVAEAIAIAIDVTRALDFALARAVIHRDIKPSNILRTSGGMVKLTDFGLARASIEETSLTGSGTVVGTLAYLAPERFAGQPADHRCDIYALGMVIHELITGSRPGDGAPLSARRSTAPPLGPIGEPLRAVLRRMLDPDPERRHPDYATLLSDLERARS